ncbi:MAG: hypothetical protein QXP73_06300 [Candidatus Methanomethylicaceae archaeon]|nr:hypothetical protein [Candidatus Verstraetearchaeota archaeon]
MGTNEATVVTGTAAGFLLIMIFMIFALPRRLALIPVLSTAILMTIGQQVVIGGANFTFLRIVILFGWIRVFAKAELGEFQKNSIDKAFIWWVILAVIIGLIPKERHPDAVMPDPGLAGAIMNKAGFAFDALGGYFLARCMVRTKEDVVLNICALVVFSVALAIFMTVEKSSGRNLFSTFGAVSEFTVIREGRLRCQGPFTHPIHAGNFGATLLPLCIGLWVCGRRKTALVGAVAATIVTASSASSGPLMVWMCGIVGLSLWPFRDNMKWVRRSTVLLLIALEMVMKSHVWWIIARVGDLVGGGSYWRAKLIDQFVSHFSEWWLKGTNYTAHWSPTGVGLPLYPDMMDLTNQFVAEGVNGGLIRLTLFIVIIVRCFKQVGLVVRDVSTYDLASRFLFWAIGSSLFAYLVAFMSVSISSQTALLYYSLLAFISCELPTKRQSIGAV